MIFYRSLFLTAFILSAPLAHAIRGEYLPESELPHNVCKIVVGTLRQTLQPSSRRGTPLAGYPAVVIDTPDQFVCSSNLIAPDTILTAGHCFQGNNEWKIRKGTFKYPKFDDHGNRAAGCEGDDYMKRRECETQNIFGTLTVKWLDVRVECPKEDNSGMEVRPLKENMGYSNPFYNGSSNETRRTISISVANFDFAFYKLQNPITNITPMEVEWDYEKMASSLKINEIDHPNPFKDIDLCRSFGYGTYDERLPGKAPVEKHGVLHGANTPPTRMDPGFIEAAIDARYQLPGLGWVDHGDSGGAYLCRGRNDRHYKLYGIVSRGITQSEIEKAFEGQEATPNIPLDELDDFMHTISKAEYSLPSYNRFFFEYATQKGNFPRSLDRHYWWDLFAPFEQQQIQNEIDQTQSCIQKSKREMTRSSFTMYRTNLKMVQGLLSKATLEASSWGAFDPGLFLTKIHEFTVLKKNRQLYWDCRNKSFFSDR